MSAETEQFLGTLPLFQGLDQKHRAVIAKTVFERSFPAGEVILREGEQGLGAYMIRSGQVEVVHLRVGREERISTLGPGKVFGELALLTDSPRTATVRAVEPTTCLVLTAWNFRAELKQSAEMAYQLLEVVARRLVEAESRAQEQ